MNTITQTINSLSDETLLRLATYGGMAVITKTGQGIIEFHIDRVEASAQAADDLYGSYASYAWCEIEAEQEAAYNDNDEMIFDHGEEHAIRSMRDGLRNLAENLEEDLKSNS